MLELLLLLLSVLKPGPRGNPPHYIPTPRD